MFEKNYRLQDIQLSKNLLGCGLSARGFGPYRASVQIFIRPRWLYQLRQAAFASLRLACLAEVRLCVALFTPHFGGSKAGGEYRARTGDLLVANQALSQLS